MTGAVSDDRLTIEREKIRHRRPDDMRPYADDGHEEPAAWPDDEWSDQEVWSDQEGDSDQEQQESWSNEEQSWDNEADGEWVFGGATPDEEPDDSGIVWEDDDNIEISASHDHERYEDNEVVGPEVELAGRRDVRPRAPKPPSQHASKPRAAKVPKPRPASVPHPPGAEHQRRVVDDQLAPPTQPPRMRGGLADDDVTHNQRSAPVRQSPPKDQSQGRFARTQATMEHGIDAPPPLVSTAPPPQTNRRSSSRRQQSQPATAPYYARPRRRWLKSLVLLVLLVVLGSGGWFTYRQFDVLGGIGLIDRLNGMLGLSGSNRTAADTPFGGAVSPEDAVANLPRENEGDSGIDVFSLDAAQRQRTGDAGVQAGDPLKRTDGPPLPEFKPRSGEQEQTSLSRSIDVPAEDERAAVLDDNPEPSIFERLFSYLQPG